MAKVSSVSAFGFTFSTSSSGVWAVAFRGTKNINGFQFVVFNKRINGARSWIFKVNGDEKMTEGKFPF